MHDTNQAKAHWLNSLSPPNGFFQRIIDDIPVALWVSLLQELPHLKEALLEGFSVPAGKLPRHLQRPELQSRLRRLLREDAELLDLVLDIWGHEQLALMAYLEMLDPTFLLENLRELKNLLGPERFLAGLCLLDRLDRETLQSHLGEGYWERQTAAGDIEPFLPVFTLWKQIVAEIPPARQWLIDLAPGPEKVSPASAAVSCDEQEFRHKWHEEEERRHKVEKKLGKVGEENRQIQEQLTRYRRENEELRKSLAELEKSFDQRLESALDRYRLERFQRYQSLDASSLTEFHDRLGTLLRRADRAFELQRQADEQYGLLATVCQQLLQVELYLKEIERIYSDSLVVHAEVAKVKDGLLGERDRIRKLPGLDRVLHKEPALTLNEDLRQKLRLLEPLPANLPTVQQLQDLLQRLASLDLFEDMSGVLEDVAYKKRQILETIYARFRSEMEPDQRVDRCSSLDDLVRAGRGDKYDLFVDGYNILLTIHSPGMSAPISSLTAVREQFIDAIARKSHLFRKIYLVFDGVEASSELRGNLEVIYSDKTRGQTADAVIIGALKKRRDRQTLLVTADRGILDATDGHVYAIVDPYYFYAFIFGVELPPLEK